MKHIYSRRRFIKTCAAAGVAAGTLAALPEWFGWTEPAHAAPSGKNGKKHYMETKLLLGTFVGITVAADSGDLAAQATEAAFAEVGRLRGIFDRRDSATPLAELNRTGTIKDAPPELAALTAQSLRLWHGLGGAFDVSVAPLVDLIMNSSTPDRAEMAEARALADPSSVLLTGECVSFKKSGMALTFDGIAKGSIADAASKVLTAHGCPDHMVDAGGDIMARGLRADGLGWKAGVRDPADDSSVLASTRLFDRAVATSGIYERCRDHAGRLNHLVCPQSGMSQPWFVSVSVTAPTACYADALATALSALPPEAAMNAVNGLPDCAALFLHRDGTVVRSARWA